VHIVRSCSVSSRECHASSTRGLRLGVIALVVAALISTPSRGQSSPGFSLNNIGPSGGQVYGAIAGVAGIGAVATILAVNHSHHTLTGCVFEGPEGLRLQSSDSKIYAIEGDAASIKAGDKVKLHGSRVKKAKGYSGDQAFMVQKLSKNYGPCHATLAQVSRPAE